MADKWWGFGGSSGNGGTGPSDAYDDLDLAIANSVGDDTLWVTDGTVAADGTDLRHNLTDERTVQAVTYQQAILQANSGHGDRVFECDGLLTSADESFIHGLVFDGESRVDHTVSLWRDAATSVSTNHFDGCKFLNPTDDFIEHQIRGGTLTLTNCDMVSDSTSVRVMNKTSFGGDAAQTLRVNGLNVTATGMTAGQTTFFVIDAVDNATNAKSVDISNYKATLTNTSTSAFFGLKVVGIDGAVVEGCDLLITLANNTADSRGIWLTASGKTVVTADDVQILRNKVRFYSPIGFGIQYGESTTASRMAGGKCSGNYVEGKYYASNSPHGIAVGEDTSADVFSNVVKNMFVGILISEVDGGSFNGNLCYGCYGPSLYVKGAKTTVGTASVANNVCVVPAGTSLRTWGIMSVVSQTTATTGADITDNLVVCGLTDTELAAETAYLAYEATGQTCTWARNTYIIPDTVNLSTANLFFDAANGASTFATWSSTRTGERIVQLPAAQIAAIVGKYGAQVDAASGAGGGASGSIGIGM